MAAGHFLPNVGGVERYVYNLSKALIRQGSEVAVVASLPANAPLAESLEGMDVFRLPSMQLAGGRLPIPTPCSPTVRRQLRAIETWRPDIFVIHTHLFLSNLHVARLARRMKKPCILINHGSGYVTTGSKIVTLALKAYEHYLAHRIGRLSTSAFGVSLTAARWLGEFGMRTDRVIANGVDMTSMPSRDPAFRERIGISQDTCLIAFAARLLPEKGADSLISAFQALNPSNAALVIAGDGPALPHLRRASAGDSRIRFLGACSHPDVLGLFGAADIMAYPSRYPEGQPTTVLEAGAMGCAVIASPRGGTAELIDSPALGLIVDSQAGLEGALQRLLADAPLRQSMGRDLQQKILSHHDWKVIAEDAALTFSSICRDFEKAYCPS